MLSIPLIQAFIEKGAMRQPVADIVDHLNYFVTACILGFFALATSAKQYFGTPIQCWVPDEFNKAWESYAEDICFIQSSYYIPFDEEMPEYGEARQDHISYYRWVPIMLALQCMFFYLPNFVWNILHRKTSLNPDAFLKEAEKLNGLVGVAREEELSKLAKYFMETVSIFGTADANRRLHVAPRSGKNTMRLYLLTKTLYVVNIYCQVILLSKFLGENYLKWGYDSFRSIVMGTDGASLDQGSNSTAVAPVFPRVIMCDFQIRELGNNIYTRSIQCVLMMNMINEKLYLFLYFWFIFLSVVTFVNFCYYIAMYALPKFRRSVILLKTSDDHKNVLEPEEMARFCDECLHPDGVLLLQFLREHVSGRVAYDVASKVLELYGNQEEVKSCLSELCGKEEVKPFRAIEGMSRGVMLNV